MEWIPPQRDRQADLARLRGLRPIDDDFMRCIFRDNIPLAQFVLRILTRKSDLVITRLETQRDMKRLVGARSVCLDAYGTDAEGRKYDLEIQRSDRGAGSRRARYHASVMDIENLDAGQDFEALPETYTIFITEHDVLKKGRACYCFDRMDTETGEPLDDGSHILFVNGAYAGEDEFGDLMHDFSCWNPGDMRLDLMRETARYYKETQEGVEFMCKAFEETWQEGFERGIQQGIQQGMQRGVQQGMQQGEQQGKKSERLENTRTLMRNLGWSAKQAMEALSVPSEERESLAQALAQR